MPAKLYTVGLSPDERIQLEKISQSPHRSIREKTRARVLLLTDVNRPKTEGGSQTDGVIAQKLRVSDLTVANVRQRACERGAVASIERKEQTKRKGRVLDGEAEAHLIATACSAPPEGSKRWTISLLHERLIQAQVVEQVGRTTVFNTLKKMNSNRG